MVLRLPNRDRLVMSAKCMHRSAIRKKNRGRDKVFENRCKNVCLANNFVRPLLFTLTIHLTYRRTTWAGLFRRNRRLLARTPHSFASAQLFLHPIGCLGFKHYAFPPSVVPHHG